MPFKKKKRIIKSRRRRKQPIGRWRLVFRYIFILFFIAFVLYGIYFITRLSYFTIEVVQVTGGETVSHEVVQDKVEKLLVGSRLFLVPKRFIYAYPKDAIAEAVTRTSRVRDVRVTRDSRTLLVDFDEYISHALWCGSDSTCFFIDTEGYIFADAPTLSGHTFMRHLRDDEVSTGEYVLSEDVLTMIDVLTMRLKQEIGFRVTEIFHRSDGDIEFRLNGGGMFLITADSDADEVYENIVAVLTSEAYQHLAPGNFSYVDVRFSNKVFVKEDAETTEEKAEEETEESETNDEE